MATLIVLFGALMAPGSMREAFAQSEAPAWVAIEASGPAARWNHTLSADADTGRLVLFGGRDAAGAPFGDTWTFSPEANAWEVVQGAGPSPRFGQAVAVDANNRTLYLFGGQADGATFFNDVWRFDLDDLTWAEVPTAEPRPAPRYGTSAVLDSDGQILISHGFTFEGRFDDTWSFDPASGVWTDLSPAPETRPLKRCLHEAVWDAERSQMLLYGGCSSGFGPCPQGDLWAFDPTTQTWTELTPPDGPAARSNPALVLDDVSGTTRLIAGLTEAGYAADAWALDQTSGAPVWTEEIPGAAMPTPRASHDAVGLNGDLYLFGGFSDAGVLADLWVLKGER